ncbi:MAG: AAA family ATPase [Candidatus Thiodiazotropha sp.]
MFSQVVETDQQNALVRQLIANPGGLGAGQDSVEHIETHISHLLLAGDFVYKIKKPVNLGFLDFSTLEKRRLCCEEEVRLNRRLAPALYVGVVGIGGDVDQPEVIESGEPLEYAVKMRRFRQEDLLDRQMLERDTIDELARLIADFHQTAEVCSNPEYTAVETILKPMRDNFQTLRALKQPLLHVERLNRLQTWLDQQALQHQTLLEERAESGRIRECHGDLHLGNITRFEGRITPFDGIEFNPELRWIDTLNDLAFLLMDLQYRGMNAASSRLLNQYLACTGDYAGLPLLSLYQCYRAMVRAKVHAIRAFQPGLSAQSQKAQLEEYQQYIELAEELTRHPPASLTLTHGLSGSGKTTVSDWMSEQLMAIRLRSDVERKRLFPNTRDGKDGDSAQRYSEAANRTTYAHLSGQAKHLLQAGYSVIVDAAFLKQWQRTLFLEMARRLGVPVLIVDCHARDETLEARVLRRSQAGEDASEADLSVLELQRRSCEQLNPEEQSRVVRVETESFPPQGFMATLLQRFMQADRDLHP